MIRVPGNGKSAIMTSHNILAIMSSVLIKAHFAHYNTSYFQAAFPNIVEESSEKNKHIFVRRSFKLPDELCDEVRQIVIGTGTKHPVTKTIQIPSSLPLPHQGKYTVANRLIPNGYQSRDDCTFKHNEVVYANIPVLGI